MSEWVALAGSAITAMCAWRASPSVALQTEAGRRRARWLAAACTLAAAAVWIDALGWLPGACAACLSIGASCSVTPFAVEALRRMGKRIAGARACRTAS
jgi:hypothetical protein